MNLIKHTLLLFSVLITFLMPLSPLHPAIVSPTTTADFAYKTVDEWFNVCMKLPYYRTIGQNYTHKPTKLTAQEMEQALKMFTNTMKSRLTNNTLWVDNDPPENSFFNVPSFKPYTQKLIVPEGSEIAFHGDLHGDIHSVVLYLNDLKKNNRIDNTFKITQSNFYIVFLGDYVDRGNYGLEVIYTLLRLKIANPDKVFMVRGNHEDSELNSTMGEYGFLRELQTKLKGSINFFLIYNIYEFLPVVLYVGSNNNFIQCNHGGLELGYLPTSLLDFKPTQSISYEWLGELKKSDNEIKLSKKFQIENILFRALPVGQRDQLLNFTPEKPFEVGFLWNDFTLKATEPITYQSDRGWKFNELFTQEILKISSTQNNKVVGVFRAHQHNADPNDEMMKLIRDGLGVSKLWQSPENKNKILWDGVVATFNVTPDTIYGEELKFNDDNYAILKTGKKFPEDWNLTLYANTVIKEKETVK